MNRRVSKNRLPINVRLADKVARVVGSWTFILVQSTILFIWAALNVVSWQYRWDPYPFILMNLFLSLQAAYTAPMIMISQNRLAKMDRKEMHQTFLVGRKGEGELQDIIDHLSDQDKVLAFILKELEKRSK